jgi:hypothetical protein
VRAHWSLAVRGTILTLALALVASLGFAYYLDRADALAFLYGVGIGMLSFASIAVTVSMFTVRPTGRRILFGAAFYVGRLVFAAVAVAVPVYAGGWPALPVLGGLAGVYAIENVVVLLLASRSVGAGHEGVERRTES